MPDRSNHTPNLDFMADDDLDIAWFEGALRDGRPYRAEYWLAERQIFNLTVFVARIPGEELDRPAVKALLEDEGILLFWTDKVYASARAILDATGADVWTINAVVSDRENQFADILIPIQRYDITPNPRTTTPPEPAPSAPPHPANPADTRTFSESASPAP